MSSWRALRWGICGCLLWGSKLAEASVQDVFGYGPRSSAMGATGASVGEGFETVYSNPALLSTVRERRLTLGFLGATYNLEAGEPIPYEALRGSFIGVTMPIPLGGTLQDRITIGLGFFTPFDLIVRGRILYPEVPQFLIADRTQSVTVQAAMGADLGYGLRIGGGFSALAALTGSVLAATDASGRIGTVVEDTLVASYGPLAGVSYEFSDDYRVGLTFRGELKARFNVVITVKDLGDIVVPPLNISGVAQYDPMQWALEFARYKGPIHYAIGLTYKHWSAYPGPNEQTVRCPDEDPETGEAYDGPCDVSVPVDPDYSDTLNVHVGGEKMFYSRKGIEMFARAGYFFEPTPSPPQSGESNRYENTRSVFTLGYGVRLSNPLPDLDLNLFSQFHYFHPQTHVKDSNDATSGVPDEVESRGNIWVGGMTAGVKF